MNDNPYRGPRSGADGLPQKTAISKALKVLAVLGLIGLGICLLLPVSRGTRGASGPARNQCANQLRQIALALQNYATVYHALPPACTVDADGRPLHSWRSLILPYVEELPLYKSIDFSKPWNDPVNAEARQTAVAAYQCPAGSGPENCTTYLAVVGTRSAFLRSEPRILSDITDPAGETLLVIEVDVEHAVPWMSPVDADEQLVLGIGPESRLAHFGGVQAARRWQRAISPCRTAGSSTSRHDFD